MPDRPSSSDDDRYRWLYSGPGEGGPSSSDSSDGSPPGAEDDPDATRAMRVPGPPPAPRSSTPPPAEPDRPRPRQQPQQPQQPRADLPPPNLPPPGGASPREQPRSRPRSRPPSRARVVRRVLLALVLVWLLFLVLVPIWAWSQIEKVDATPAGERPGDQPGTTYLIVGSDSRAGLSAEERADLATGNAEGGRTDTIMILHTGDGPTTLVSVPRDSPVEIPGVGGSKINSAFSSGGAPLLVETVEQNTGIRVDGYVQIGLGGFVDVVDALGGVEICPEEAVQDRKAGLDIAAGCQEADGTTALGFARTRAFASADLQRVQNQRQVVSAIADKAASPWTVLNPWRYYRLASAGAGALVIGEEMGPIDLARFAWAMGGVSGGGKTCTVPLASADATWDPELSQQLFELIIADQTGDIGADLCQANGLG
ncbi:MAG: transcriptional regulator [Nocardioidaceae bacterium]|nr:transcriptional regulator [Nocardioidaceae bacterium]